jgi:hypothetical protein
MKLMNNTENILIPIAVIAVVLCAPSILTAQTSNQISDRQKTAIITTDTSIQTFVEKSSAQISKRFAELNAQEEANILAKQKAISEAKENKYKADIAQDDAESALLARKREIDTAQMRLKQLQTTNPTPEQLSLALNELSKAERARDAAQLALTDLTGTVNVTQYNVMLAEVELNKANAEFKSNAEIRIIQMNML